VECTVLNAGVEVFRIVDSIYFPLSARYFGMLSVLHLSYYMLLDQDSRKRSHAAPLAEASR